MLQQELLETSVAACDIAVSRLKGVFEAFESAKGGYAPQAVVPMSNMYSLIKQDEGTLTASVEQCRLNKRNDIYRALFYHQQAEGVMDNIMLRARSKLDTTKVGAEKVPGRILRRAEGAGT